MLKALVVSVMPLLATCTAQAASLRYCAADSTEMSIHFADRVIIFASAGTGDQRFAISPCSNLIESCFEGEISFVNPYRSQTSLNRNVLRVQERGGLGYTITTRGSGTLTSYYIERTERFPREFRTTDIATGQRQVWTRC